MLSAAKTFGVVLNENFKEIKQTFSGSSTVSEEQKRALEEMASIKVLPFEIIPLPQVSLGYKAMVERDYKKESRSKEPELVYKLYKFSRKYPKEFTGNQELMIRNVGLAITLGVDTGGVHSTRMGYVPSSLYGLCRDSNSFNIGRSLALEKFVCEGVTPDQAEKEVEVFSKFHGAESPIYSRGPAGSIVSVQYGSPFGKQIKDESYVAFVGRQNDSMRRDMFMKAFDYAQTQEGKNYAFEQVMKYSHTKYELQELMEISPEGSRQRYQAVKKALRAGRLLDNDDGLTCIDGINPENVRYKKVCDLGEINNYNPDNFCDTQGKQAKAKIDLEQWRRSTYDELGVV